MNKMKLGEMTLRQIKEIKDHCEDYLLCDGCPFQKLESCAFYDIDDIVLDSEVDVEVEEK